LESENQKSLSKETSSQSQGSKKMYPRCHTCHGRRYYRRGKLGDIIVFQCGCGALYLCKFELSEVEDPLVEMPFGSMLMSKNDPHYAGDGVIATQEAEINVYKGQPKAGKAVTGPGNKQ